MAEWLWRYRSRSKFIAHDTPSHASDHLCQIGTGSTQNCTCCRMDTARCAISVFPKGFQAMSANIADIEIFYVSHFHFMTAKLKKNYKSHELFFCQFLNASQNDWHEISRCRTFKFYGWQNWHASIYSGGLSYFSSFIAKSWLNDLKDIGQGQRSLCVTHPLMLLIICA